MIDLSKTKLIVLTYPTCAVDWRLAIYFLDRGLPYQNIVAVNNQCSVVESRNRTIRDQVINSDADWIIFSDYDHYPDGRFTAPFLEDIPADIVGCTYRTGNEGSWILDDNFHMGFCRVRPNVFRTMQAPYFLFSYSEDGTQIASCECGYFRRKALEHGFTIRRRGFVNHEENKPSWHTSS